MIERRNQPMYFIYFLHFFSAVNTSLPSPAEIECTTVYSLTLVLFTDVDSALPCQQPIAALPAATLFLLQLF